MSKQCSADQVSLSILQKIFLKFYKNFLSVISNKIKYKLLKNLHLFSCTKHKSTFCSLQFFQNLSWVFREWFMLYTYFQDSTSMFVFLNIRQGRAILIETRTKVVHNNLSKGYNKIRRSKSYTISRNLSLQNINVANLKKFVNL